MAFPAVVDVSRPCWCRNRSTPLLIANRRQQDTDRDPSHDRWKVYGNEVIEALEVLDLVSVTQIRPLLMAVFNNFTADEVKKALPATVARTVRFLICGSGGSGTLETYYAERAKEVSTKKIKTAAQLFDAMKSVLPADGFFEDVFAPRANGPATCTIELIRRDRQNECQGSPCVLAA